MNSRKALIRKAVFPVAGMGTRFLPATKASPKEMLTVVNKPLIQYAVEEAYAAGIRQMIFVICHNKNVIEDHFDMAYQFESELIALQKSEFLAVVKSVTPEDMACFYVRQPKAYGLGQAVLCAEHLVENEPFAVLLADDLMRGAVPVMKQMVQVYEQYEHSLVAVQNVPKHLTQHYGVIQGEAISDELLSIQRIVEKPSPDESPSNIAVVGRYILNFSVFEHLKALPKKDHQEMQLTDGIAGLLAREPVWAYRFEGQRYDCGSLLGFLQANVELGMQDPREGAHFFKWLSDVVFHHPKR